MPQPGVADSDRPAADPAAARPNLPAALVLGLFTLTLFVSSALLFVVQPLFAKMVLPLLGGTPAVWNTCMVFFQAALLAGYAYAHLASSWLGVRRHLAVHVLVVLLPLLSLPLAVWTGWAVPRDHNPIPWLLALLAVSLGLPFTVVATTGPLIQKWFTHTGHPAARDPYFLYAASNLGSMLALLGYPVLIEPWLAVQHQRTAWSVGYGVLIVLVWACAACVARSRPAADAADAVAPAERAAPLAPRRALWWILLTFVPSSLMLGVTTFLTTDVAAVPLLWVLPLALYLLTFILCFARRPPLTPATAGRAFALAALVLALLLLMNAGKPLWLVLPTHLAAFFFAALLCHGRLAHDRPAPAHLTTYYLLMAVGGVLGGLFNALLAPLLFHSVAEYSLALVLAAALLLPDAPAATRPRGSAALWDLAALVLTALWVTAALLLLRLAQYDQHSTVRGLAVAPAVLAVLTLRHRPTRFAAALAGLLLPPLLLPVGGQVQLTERSFFGVHRVVVNLDPQHPRRTLLHGTTRHGAQSLDPAHRAEPLSYYHRTGPMGRLFAALDQRGTPPRVGLVGLGAGALAAYGQPAQAMDFYEIDPTVARLAQDPQFFTYLPDARARGVNLRVILGDARLTLADAPPAAYDLLVIDAFSSDAIPMHLLTREAVALYRSRLAADGVLALHISNQFLDLAPIVGNLAHAAGLQAWLCDDRWLSPEQYAAGKDPSRWVVLARQAADLGPLLADDRWQPLGPNPAKPLWTDDFCNLLSALDWGR